MKNFILCFILFVTPLIAQDIVINEAMSSNNITIYDQDGDTPDWIELYNTTGDPINLNNFGITDDNSELYKWTFPDIDIAAQEYFLLFASGKNRRFSHLETVIDWGAEWKYFLGFAEPPSDWREIAFDDSIWFSGPTGIGRGEGNHATVIPLVISFYIRHAFTVADTSNVSFGILNVDYDDAFVAYLNGAEIARANIGSPGLIPTHNDFAEDSHDALIFQGGLPSQFILDDLKTLLIEGDNVLCIQTHNNNPDSNDLTMIPFLTLAMYEEPESPNGLAEILEPLQPYLHTNFKISSSGETLFLVNDLGVIVDTLDTGEIPTDISIGHQPDGNGNIYYFEEPTPADSNYTYGYQNIADAPDFNIEGGFYTDSVEITLSGNQAGETIFLTLDGTEPDETSYEYTTPFIVNSTTVVRARTIGPNSLPSTTVTNTYFFDVSHTMPIISLATTPANFFDYETGIYVMGPNAGPTYPFHGANFWQPWEKPIHIEIFANDGTRDFVMDGGTRIHGRWSRGKPQKSLAIFARSKYGSSSINYQLFEDKSNNDFQAFLLRNSGGDWNYSHCRDVIVSTVMENEILDYQEYEPVVAYLNGEYWGFYNMREKVNEHFIAENNPGVDPDNIDYLVNDAEPMMGDSLNYHNLKQFIIDNDITLPENYEYVTTQIDIENYAKYLTANLYFDNEDWPDNNIGFWRDRSPEGKWRWILDDCDWGFSFASNHGWDHNTFENVLIVSPNSSYEAWCTFLIREMVSNITFRNALINCIADYMNTIYQPENILSVIDEVYNIMLPEWQMQVDRWSEEPLIFSQESWDEEMTLLRDYAIERHLVMPDHIMNTFNITSTSEVTLDVSDSGLGNIGINYLELDAYPWNGNYYETVPVLLKALPEPGYEFVEWTGDFNSTEDSVYVSLIDSMYITAVFMEAGSAPGDIVINEINYNSSPTINPDDWIEIYNNGSFAIDLSNWQFKDQSDDDVFMLPEGLILLPDSYYVLCKDTVAFHQVFPDVENYIGDWGFGLNANYDMVRIFNDQETLVDFVLYDDENPWPSQPDGNGPTLSLKNPGMENQLPQSWAASEYYGTPGEFNEDVYVSAENQMPDMPSRLILHQNFPNPFNPVTSIKYYLPEDAPVELRIYNLKGQLTKLIVDEFQSHGEHTVAWDGTDSNEKPVASGLYFYQLAAGKNRINRKMLLLK
ncbi:CotH kinase family protein [Candidatus Cloacimonadota bacterium]